MIKLIKARKKALRIIFISIGLLLAFPLLNLVVFILGSLIPSGNTIKLEEAARQFQPGREWALKQDETIPPRLICLEGCGYIYKVWESNDKTVQDKESMKRLIPVSAENTTYKCGNGFCDIRYDVGKIHISISTSPFQDIDNPATLTMKTQK